DTAAAPAPAEETAPDAPTPDATARMEALIADPEHPVVLFALEWCEFCWSVRKLLTAAGVPFRSVDLDSAAYREGDLGRAVRKALAARAGALTIPQDFVGGRHIGGATETFDAFNDGSLGRMLATLGHEVRGVEVGDAYRFLPAWLHPRKP